MSYTSGTLSDVGAFDGSFFIQGLSRRNLIGALLVGVGTLSVAWVVVTSVTAPIALEQEAVAPKTLALGNPYGALHSAPHVRPSAPLLTNPAAAPDLSDSSSAPQWFLGASAPSDSALPQSADVPLPPKRPVPDLARSLPSAPSHVRFRPANRRTAPQTTPANAATAAPDNRNFFEKIFNIPQQPAGPVLAYAQPEGSSIGSAAANSKSIVLSSFDNRTTAIYDIRTHTVYMPNGERLEAHSGLGNRLDDPSRVNEKNLGATPPHEYELAMRGPLFHGIPALRLNPVGGGNMFGRTGLLAHTYMLGPTGASNGCVSFRDYSKFLQAFERGEVTRLVVVPRLG